MTDKIEQMIETAMTLVSKGRGILAIDESTGTCQKRFDSIGVECTKQNRRDYRHMLLSTEGLSEFISGAILFDETLRQSSPDDVPLVEMMQKSGIIPGIKVDKGAQPMAGFEGEKVTEGLDGLRDRLEEYYELGARFAKWRAVITISETTPSQACISANSHALARYASLCQEAGLVPIVEPEVLMDGDHDISTCYEVTDLTLKTLFDELHDQDVVLEACILKASMVISGADCDQQADIEEVAEATLNCLSNTVPAALAGIVFLSGGQTEIQATEHLDAMNQVENLPWPLSFSYGRALQASALKMWGNNPQENIGAAQAELYHRAKMNGLAAVGQYDPKLEQQ